MTNTAKILNFGRGNFAGQERNVADLDDGYARLSNMLLEAYSGADLTKRQFKVLLAILRKTYGWNKPMDRITDSQLSEITKLPVKRCNEAKLELVRMNIIKQQGGMFGSARLWRVSTKFALSLMDGLILSNHRQGWRRRETAKAPCC